MSRELLNLGVSTEAWSGSDQGSVTRIVAVGDLQEWEEKGHPLPDGGGISFLSFHDINEATLGELSPSIVYSPVLARDFDCIELAVLLHNIGFSGTYRAIGEGLPKPQLIEREVLQICPRLEFEIVAT